MLKKNSILFQIYVIDSADRKRFEETGQVCTIFCGCVHSACKTGWYYNLCSLSVDFFCLKNYSIVKSGLYKSGLSNSQMFVCFRSWLSCWMKRSWAEFLCWFLRTSRTCWQLPLPPRSRRVSICIPSAIACGRFSPAPPSLEKGFKWALFLKKNFCFYMPLPLLLMLSLLNFPTGGYELGL